MTNSPQAKSNENSSLVIPIDPDRDQGKQHGSKKEGGYRLLAGVLALVCIATVYVGSANQGSLVRNVSSSLVLGSTTDIRSCYGRVGNRPSGIEIITCIFQPTLPIIIENLLKPYDPMVTAAESSTVNLGFISVTYGEVNIEGLSSLDVGGLELNSGFSTPFVSSVVTRPGTFMGMWTQTFRLPELSVETKVDISAPFGISQSEKATVTITDSMLSINFRAEGTYELEFFTSEVTKASVESVSLDLGSFSIAIDLDDFGGNAVEQSFESFFSNTLIGYINQKLPGLLNSQIEGELPYDLSLLARRN